MIEEALYNLFQLICLCSESEMIDSSQVYKACKQKDPSFSFEMVNSAMNKLFPSGRSGQLSQEQFDELLNELQSQKNQKHQKHENAAPSFKEPQAAELRKELSSGNLRIISGATESSQHSIDEDEVEQYVKHINSVISDDRVLSSRYPIKNELLFQECQDGLLLSKLINQAVPETIDERALNSGKELNMFQKTENNNLVINSAKAIGCSVVNIGSADLIEGRPHLVLGLVWQIIKRGLLAKINLQYHPELYRLLKEDETLEDLLRLPADELLLRWFNYQLANSGRWEDKAPISNFSNDIKDSHAYLVLLHTLKPQQCSMDALRTSNLKERAEAVVLNAEKIDCREYVTEKAILEGNPRLNLAFVATLFNKYPNLAPLTEAERCEIDEELFNAQGDREARALTMWLNSLGVEPLVMSIFKDLSDGNVLLQALNKLKPERDQTAKVFGNASLKERADRFISLERCNRAVKQAKEGLGLNVTGLQGADLTDGNKTLTLGLVWQMMCFHVLKTLNGVTDSQIITWANKVVNGAAGDISSFKDQSLKNGRFLLALLDKLSPGSVNKSLIVHEGDEEGHKQNAKYAISIARKLGATIFVLPEDILEVRAKLIMTFMGSLMALFNGKSQ